MYGICFDGGEEEYTEFMARRGRWMMMNDELVAFTNDKKNGVGLEDIMGMADRLDRGEDVEAVSGTGKGEEVASLEEVIPSLHLRNAKRARSRYKTTKMTTHLRQKVTANDQTNQPIRTGKKQPRTSCSESLSLPGN
ncbi:hypothetical protein OQA88_13577 [Cercophora sp. LCS_1]